MVTTFKALTITIRPIDAEMAQHFPRSPLRIPFTDPNRIKSGFDRAEKILQKGIPTYPRSVPPIDDISVHGRWDGIVDHSVDVKISLTV